MKDKSYLDQKYFIDKHIYNCPYCNRNNVAYTLENPYEFDWSNEKNVTFILLNVHHVSQNQFIYHMKRFMCIKQQQDMGTITSMMTLT